MDKIEDENYGEVYDMEERVELDEGYALLKTFEDDGSLYGFYVVYNDEGVARWSTPHKFIRELA